MRDAEPLEVPAAPLADCFLCSPQLGPVLAEGEHWKLVLNVNQNLLGKCMLVLRRHLERVPELTLPEWVELHAEIGRAYRGLVAAFRPDHFNYAFMQNQDRHVHCHVIPRYAGTRHFAGMEFSDPDYPGHYTSLNAARRLSDGALAALAAHLRAQLPAAALSGADAGALPRRRGEAA